MLCFVVAFPFSVSGVDDARFARSIEPCPACLRRLQPELESCVGANPFNFVRSLSPVNTFDPWLHDVRYIDISYFAPK